jgi:DNA polymerase-1
MALIKLTIGAEKKNYPMGLKENTKLILNRDSLELSDLIIDNSWGENDIKFWDLPAELVRLYACADTDNTNGLLQYALQNDLLGRYNARKVYDIEIAFSYAVAYQEFYGHHIDIQHLATLRENIGIEQDKVMKQMEAIIGHEFNPNSPKQLTTILYGELGIPEQISRKTGRPTTDKETLNKLAEITDAEDNIKYPFCALLQKYREYEGVRKIVDKFPEHVTEDGFIFSHVMQYGTTTGRVSINTPNYQSYNDPIKKNIIPRDGFWMFDTDYSSVEYRVLGNMVRNERIKESFKDPDFDYHAYQAARMYGVPYSAVDKKMRKAAKGINFGLPYGMGDESLGIRIFGEASPENTRKAGALRSAYFKGQEDIRDWFEFHRDKGVNLGYTETYFDRRRYYHREDFSVNAIRRQAGNQVIQGTAADIYKLAVGRVFKRICREGWLGKVLLSGFIHDELLGEVSNDINPAQWLKILREEFEVKVTDSDGTDWCPLYMGFGYGTSWYEAKSVELPIKFQWEFVEKYGETGYPDWDGNGRAFCDKIPIMLRDFDIRDIKAQLLDPDSQDKEIKPTLNNQVLACIKDDASAYKSLLDEYPNASEDELLSLLEKHCFITGLMKSEDGVLLREFKPAKTTQEAIDQYCILHDVDRSLINVLDIEEYTGGGSALDDNVAYYIESDEDLDTDKLAKIIDTKIQTLGMYPDIEGKKVIALLPHPERGRQQFLTQLSQFVNKEGKGYALVFRDYWECPGDRPTTSYITSENLSSVQNLYLVYLGGRII